MKKFMAIAALIFIGVLAWKVGERLSHDALTMALGMLFGVMAGVPAALMVIAAQRREMESSRRNDYRQPTLPAPTTPPYLIVSRAAERRPRHIIER